MRAVCAVLALTVLGLSASHAIAIETGAPDKPPAAAAATPAPATAPSPSIAPAAQAIRARTTDKRLDATAEERQAVATFFDARSGAPLFADPKGLTPQGAALLAELKLAGDYGLPSAELVPAKLPAPGAALTETDWADLEVRMSLAALKYARYACGGRIPEPSKQLATYLDRAPQLIEPLTVLETLAAAPSAAIALRNTNPQHPSFEALRKAYIEARGAKATGDAGEDPLDGAPNLRPGMSHPAVAIVRQRLKLALPTATDGKAADPQLYDPAMVEAIVAYQEANDLGTADGIIGARTRAAIASLQPAGEKTLLANMEQWRWMPSNLGETYITVNIPEFTIRMVKNGGVIHTERVVTGLVTNQTPIFSEELKTVVLQPDWVLPESIKINEALPSLQSGGGMFWSNGLKIKRGNTDVDPSEVRWSSANLKAYTFYQPPGEANVLGQVKFLFPNKHAVYMHDTPSKHLFDKAERAFSHGCMRVRNPVKLAELVLMRDKGWTAGKVAALLEDGPEDNKIALDRTIPVHVTYFTAAPGDDGKIKTFRDIYGHEQRISLALAGRWSEIDIPPDHLAPVEDREFEYRSTSVERRREAEVDRRTYKSSGGNEVEKALKNLFGGF